MFKLFANLKQVNNIVRYIPAYLYINAIKDGYVPLGKYHNMISDEDIQKEIRCILEFEIDPKKWPKIKELICRQLICHYGCKVISTKEGIIMYVRFE